MPRRRSLAGALAVAALTVALAGCTTMFPLPSQSPEPTRTHTAGQPTVGQCWDTTLASASQWADWQGNSAVPCGAEHDLYTYAVVTVTGLQPSDWSNSATDPTLSAAVATAASDACDTKFDTFLPDTTWNQELLKRFFFMPSRALWKNGARWVRCDIGVGTVGAPYATQSLTVLPPKIATLTADVKANPDRYKLCINTGRSLATGPLDDSSAVIADCTDNPQWSLALHGSFKAGADAPYPSKSAAHATLRNECSKAVTEPGEVWVGYWPLESQWVAGSRNFDCWVGHPGGGKPAGQQNA